METDYTKELTIDLNYLKATCANDTSMMQIVMKVFVDKTPGLMTSLIEAGEQRNWSEVKAIAHKLKSSFSTFGAKEISEMLAKIEEDSLRIADSGGDEGEVNSLLDRVSQLSEKALIEVNEELSKM
jgi:HPt (histidine-containing phosphotransfer) domain-containing protein